MEALTKDISICLDVNVEYSAKVNLLGRLVILLQQPDILASVTDALQALYPFLKYNKDLIMDILRKVSQKFLISHCKPSTAV